MPKFVDDEGKPIDLDLDKVLEAFPDIKSQFGLRVKARVDERFKNAPDPDEVKRLREERAQLAKEKQELEDAKKSELEKQIERASKLEAAIREAEARAVKVEQEAAAKERRILIENEIRRYADANKTPHVERMVREATSLFQVADDGKPFAEDTASGKHLSMKERLDAFRRETGNEIYNPPLVRGSNQRPGAPAPAPSADDWRKDPVLRRAMAEKQLDRLPVTGGLVRPEGSEINAARDDGFSATGEAASGTG